MQRNPRKLIRKLRLAKPKTEALHIAVIGGGSWATALIKILTENHVRVKWWLRNRETIRHIRKHKRNPGYLSNVKISRRKVRIFADLKKALSEASYVIIAVPAAFVEDALKSLSPEDLQSKVLISAVKGIIPEQHYLVTDLLMHKFQAHSDNLCVIAGPCHAEEVALEKKSYLTIAGKSPINTSQVAEALSCNYIHTSTLDDMEGVEYCAVMKNIVALACGIAHGLNYGDNYQAVLVSNAMQEIERFISAVNPQEVRNLHASAYLGDLLVTAYSQFSRNRTFGNMIGRGYTVKSAQIEMNMIAEGYYALRSVYAIKEHYQVDMPICQTAYEILYQQTAPREAFEKLSETLM